MRRDFKDRRTTIRSIIFIGLFLCLPLGLFAAEQDTVIVKVQNSSDKQGIANRNGLKIRKSVESGGGSLVVVEGKDAAAIRALLKNEPGVAFVEKNVAHHLLDDGETVLPLDDGETVLPLGSIVVPLDDGETVLPLDDGETVLPLDDGETVLPLDDGETVLPLDDGETVLPLKREIQIIRSWYHRLAVNLVPSQRFLLQLSFLKMGLFNIPVRSTGRGVTIADLNTGVDSCHKIMQGVFQKSFVAETTIPENCPTASTVHVPGFGHGTAVASMILVVAPDAKLMSLRVFDSTGVAQVSDIYEAIIYAVDHGAQVINMSFGSTEPSNTLKEALQYAHDHGVVLVAAGGNNGADGLMYPAAYSRLVDGVVATTSHDLKAGFSNYGKKAAVSAPGNKLWVAYPGNNLALASGTSFASPLVAGDAALVIEEIESHRRGNADLSDVNAAVKSGVTNIDKLNPNYAGKLGSGRIYIPKAIKNSNDD